MAMAKVAVIVLLLFMASFASPAYGDESGEMDLDACKSEGRVHVTLKEDLKITVPEKDAIIFIAVQTPDDRTIFTFPIIPVLINPCPVTDIKKEKDIKNSPPIRAMRVAEKRD